MSKPRRSPRGCRPLPSLACPDGGAESRERAPALAALGLSLPSRHITVTRLWPMPKKVAAISTLPIMLALPRAPRWTFAGR